MPAANEPYPSLPLPPGGPDAEGPMLEAPYQVERLLGKEEPICEEAV